jgi:hypothetical protein
MARRVHGRGAEALKARPTEPADRKLREAERQIGRVTMEALRYLTEARPQPSAPGGEEAR